MRVGNKMTQELLFWQVFLQFQVENWGVTDTFLTAVGQCCSDRGRQLPRYGEWARGFLKVTWINTAHFPKNHIFLQFYFKGWGGLKMIIITERNSHEILKVK